MPLQEKKAFIKDPKADMTAREKNEYLSAKLAIAPHVKRKIVRIERIENGALGWRVYYRTGSPR
jgi:hypothetical protein